MKNCGAQILRLAALAASLLGWTAAYAQITPSGDSYTNTADPALNYVSRAMFSYFAAVELAFTILVALACAAALALIGIYISTQGQSLRNCRPMSRNRGIVKSRRKIPGLALALLICLGMPAFGQITPSSDSYTNTATPTTNNGSKTLLDVDGATQVAYIQFNLASIPTTATISQATLKLYVNAVTTAGSFNVDYVNSAWSESTIDASNAPPLGGSIASNVNVTTAEKNQYILINVTSAVQAWLSGSETNNGLALVANGTFNATFDSKENTTTSHAPELDIAYAGGVGTITGVTTASGSGLTGGGASGTLNLGLTNACAANQVLQWNGSAWACTSAGAGTITGVGAGLTGGGTSGAVTLNLDTHDKAYSATCRWLECACTGELSARRFKTQYQRPLRFTRSLVVVESSRLVSFVIHQESPNQERKNNMPKYVIERELPGAGALTHEQVLAVSQKSCSVLSKLGPRIQWLHSYVTADKIYCIYIAPNEEMVREHARQGGFPANRVSAVKSIIDPSSAEV